MSRETRTSSILERLWEIPVIEGHPRVDASLEESVDESIVEIEAARLDTAHTVG